MASFRISEQTPFTSFAFMAIASASFLAVQRVFERYMAVRNKPLPYAPLLRDANNFLFGVFSGVLAVLLTVAAHKLGRFRSLDAAFCHHEPLVGNYAFLLYVFYLSKFWEFSDVMLVIANNSPVGLQFRIHHLTTPSVLWVTLHFDSGYELPLALANLTLHFFMYIHFSRVWSCRRLNITLGTTQLVMGLISGCVALKLRLVDGKPCTGSLESEAYGLFIYLVYFVLWTYDLLVQPNQAVKAARNAATETGAEKSKQS